MVRSVILAVVLSLATLGVAGGQTPAVLRTPPACAATDRLAACRDNPAACQDALVKTPKGDPIELACSAEAACLAGKAGSCGAFVQFAADAAFGGDLTAHVAGFEAGCAAGQKGACSVVPTLLELKLKKASAAEAVAEVSGISF